MALRSLPDVVRIREALGLTQDALAVLLGVHRITVGNWECQRSRPSGLAIKALRRLCRKRGVAFAEVPRVFGLAGEDEIEVPGSESEAPESEEQGG